MKQAVCVPAEIANLGQYQKAIDDYSKAIVQELMRKVEALTYRNGYLEAQLAEKATHIKLLTDSQHKPGWWPRFCSWFKHEAN